MKKWRLTFSPGKFLPENPPGKFIPAENSVPVKPLPPPSKKLSLRKSHPWKSSEEFPHSENSPTLYNYLRLTLITDNSPIENSPHAKLNSHSLKMLIACPEGWHNEQILKIVFGQLLVSLKSLLTKRKRLEPLIFDRMSILRSFYDSSIRNTGAGSLYKSIKFIPFSIEFTT